LLITYVLCIMMAALLCAVAPNATAVGFAATRSLDLIAAAVALVLLLPLLLLAESASFILAWLGGRDA
jgi:hypothetical protein